MINFSTNTNSVQQIHGMQLMKLYQDTNLVHNFQHVLNKIIRYILLSLTQLMNLVIFLQALILLKAYRVQMQIIFLNFLKTRMKMVSDIQKYKRNLCHK